MTPLERAARAIFDAQDPHTGDPIGHTIHMSDEHAYEDGTNEQQLASVMATCRVAARAVIEAIREPSEAMADAGAADVGNGWHGPHSEAVSRHGCASVYTAMIDALLDEGR